MATAIIIDRKRNVFNCPSCQRSFRTKQSLLQHCRAMARHSWCEFCKQVFEDDGVLQSHLKYHITHCTCQFCARVFRKSNNLRMIRNTQPFQQGTSADTLPQHLVVHNDADTECLICDREFTTFSGMLIHLESRDCMSEASVKERLYDYVGNGNTRDVDFWLRNDGEILLECQVCRKDFARVSGLFQHIESGSCDTHGDAIGDFEDFLRA